MKKKKFSLKIVLVSFLAIVFLLVSFSTIHSMTVANCEAIALGGTITVDGSYCVHTFLSNSSFNLTSDKSIDFIIVGGGGAGGGSADSAGGGGAGGFVNGSFNPLALGNYPIVVGFGGNGVSQAGGLNGRNSSFNNIIALGGGGGGAGSSGSPNSGASGGSGGGAGTKAGAIGGLSTQHAINYSSNTSYGNDGGGNGGAGGGGGGAMFNGSSAPGSGPGYPAGIGGNGTINSINGTAVYYAGGGGGGYYVGGAGGLGGGGRGGDYATGGGGLTSGVNGTGGGGGGISASTAKAGASGGSGIVIIRYLGTSIPAVTFLIQIPSNITTNNIYINKLNISYTITDTSGINSSHITFYSKTNSTTNEIWQYINGTQSVQGWQGLNGRAGVNITNASSVWNFLVSSSLVYPSVFNLDPEVTGLVNKSVIDLSASTQYYKIRFFNITNNSYGTFNFMANSSTNADDLRIYYCNSSYVTGLPQSTSSCVIISNFNRTTGYNYSISPYSSYNYIPFNINLSTMTVNGIKVTSMSYFVLRGPSAGDWYVSYVTNRTRADTIQQSTNPGTSWNNFSGTINAFVSQYTPSNYTNYYYVCVNNTWGVNVCSDVKSNLITEIAQYPSIPSVYSPLLSQSYKGDITISYTASESLAGMSYYNISLMQNGIFNMTIKSNNSLDLSYVWNSSEALDGYYYIKVDAVDINGFSSSGYSNEFRVQNNIPLVFLNLPLNNSNYVLDLVTFNCSATDKSSLLNLSLYINGLLNLTLVNSTAGQLNLSLKQNWTFNDGLWNYTCIASNGLGTSLNSTYYFNMLPEISEVLVLPLYPYIDINTTTLIKYKVILANVSTDIGDVNITLGNDSFVMNWTGLDYEISLSFSSISDEPFVIRAVDNSTYPDFYGTFLIRDFFSVTFCGFRESGASYTNPYGYIVVEKAGTKKYNTELESFIFPVSPLNYRVYHSPYTAGCGSVTLFDDVRYGVRLIDGQMTFNDTYAIPNITRRLSHNIFIGEYIFNRSDVAYNFIVTDKDLNPYFWLFNWLAIIFIGIGLIGSITIFFSFPEHPNTALAFFIIIVGSIIILRIAVWFYLG